MFERLRMQEVKKIIFTVPEGAVIPGNPVLKSGDPITIIDKPSTSDLTFITRTKFTESGKGFIGMSSSTSTIDFTINEGSILFGLWSYLHGDVVTNAETLIPITEEKESINDIITMSHTSDSITLYKNTTLGLQYVGRDLYNHNGDTITLLFNSPDSTYTIVYDYTIIAESVSNINQLHNNILCAVDIIIDAVDLDTDTKHEVYIRIDKAQLDADLKIFINDSAKASFTPIKIYAIPEASALANKHVAKIIVV